MFGDNVLLLSKNVW